MSVKQLISIIVVLAVFSLGGWLMLILFPQTSIPENAIMVSQQATSLQKKLQELLVGGQNIRLQEFQKTLKSFVSLPLPSRAGGKDNPFLQVTAPLDQFSRPASAQSLGGPAGATTLPTNRTISNRR